jgi:prepilin-type N-terminal cleavage/methylation domain-containing protein
MVNFAEKTRSQRSSGLTLIELLVTIGVLAIVAGISVPIITNVVNASNERASLQTESDISAFVKKYSDMGNGGYTYDPNTGTFSGYLDLDNSGTATEDEKIEELNIDLDRFSVASSASDAPSLAENIDFDNPPAATYAIVDYVGTVSPESISINGYAGYAITPTNVTAEGFEGTYSWSVSQGALPDGLALNTSTGVVTGTPTGATGPTTVTIKITDENGVSDTQAQTYEIAPAPTLTPESDTVSGQAGQAITATSATLTGFTEPYSWTVTSGTLPAGLTLNETTGSASGTPSSANSSTITITITDANDLTGNQTLTFDIDPEPSVSPTSTTVSGEAGTAITPTSVTATGFTAPYSWSVTSGTLPSGLSLDSSTGTVSGTPDSESTATVVLTVTDADGRTATQTQNYEITAPASIVVVDYGSSEAASTTGGWDWDNCYSRGVGTTNAYFTRNSNGLNIRAPYWGCGTATTRNNIDLTGVTSVTIEYSLYSIDYYGNASVSWPKADGTRESFRMASARSGPSNVSKTTVEVAVTDGGIGGISFSGGNTGDGTAYLYSMTFNY